MNLVEQHIVKSNHLYYKKIDELCFKAKNLYNSGLYEVRQHFFQSQDDSSIQYKYLNYFALNEKLKNENNECYNALPIQSSQQILRVLDQNFKSFFNLLSKKKIKEYSEQVNIPKYLKKDSRFTIKYAAQNISKKFLKDGIIKIPKTKINFFTKLQNLDKSLCEVRFVPKNGYYIFEIVYEVNEKQLKIDNKNYLSIDLGINNLATCSSNKIKSFIINGKPVKSINQYYNKQKSKYQSINATKKIKKLTLKRNNKIKDYFHKTSHYIVNQAVNNSLNTIIIGYNKEWKQEANMGKKTNQVFISIPHKMLVNMISYKAKLKGINVLIQEEAYTSKTSFIDNEPICKQELYLGKRINRGLFKTSLGLLINADINGSLNIMRKKINVVSDVLIEPAYRGLVLNPSRISF